MRLQVLFLGAALAAGPAMAADTWVEAKSPNFTAVGNAPEREVRATAWRFEQIHAAFTVMLPDLAVDAGRPVVLLVARNAKTFRGLAPGLWEKNRDARTVSVSISGTERHFVALQTEGDPRLASSQANWQYAQILMRASFEQPPLWLSEGLAEFYQATEVEDDTVTVGRPTTRQIQLLRQRPLMPIPELLAVTRESTWYTDPVRREIFDAQAWVLVHYYMFGNKGTNAAQLRDLTQRLTSGVPHDEAVRLALGDPRQIQDKLQQYVRGFQFPMWRKPGGGDVADRKTYVVRTLPEAEALAVQAEFHVAMNRPVEARQLLEQAEKADPRSSRAAEVQALLAAHEKRTADVGSWAAKAVERDQANAVAQWLLARHLDEAQAAGAEAALARAVELNPDRGEAHARLANLLVRARRDLPRAMELARRAVALEPARAWHHLVLSHVQQATGQRAEALASLRRARSVARPWDASSIAEYSKWLERAGAE